MVEYNRVQLDREAKKHGFVRDTFEKAMRLKEILKFFNGHEYLSEHLLLKCAEEQGFFGFRDDEIKGKGVYSRAYAGN